MNTHKTEYLILSLQLLVEIKVKCCFLIIFFQLTQEFPECNIAVFHVFIASYDLSI